MSEVIIYGASDDLIEVDGDFQEEFTYQGPGYGQPSGDLLAFSNGVVLRIEFGATGVWRISRVTGDPGYIHIDQAPEHDAVNYSDRAKVTGDIDWVVQGIALAK
ncbi:MAG TPA: hypothetical protein VFB74_32435 [Kribbellaceae bacterium]|nr:hypothetical protein [Kribbellaceae bacterium]